MAEQKPAADLLVRLIAQSWNGPATDVVSRLRYMADWIESECVDLPVTDLAKAITPVGSTSEGPHLWAANQIIHKITWGLANLSLGSLVTAAAHCDALLRQARSEDAAKSGESRG